jgi:hypothetical protein
MIQPEVLIISIDLMSISESMYNLSWTGLGYMSMDKSAKLEVFVNCS